MNYFVKNFIEQKLKSNYDWILENSLMNCHAKGLHSIVLDKGSNGEMVRMFVTTPDHTMWRNVYDNGYDLSVAIHSHHCSIRLIKIKGAPQNLPFEFVNKSKAKYEDFNRFSINAWEYQSPIVNGGKGGFKKLFSTVLVSRDSAYIEDTYMDREALHTVYVPAKEVAAWAVIESPDSQSKGSGICFSNADLTTYDCAEYCQKMTAANLHDLLKSIGIEINPVSTKAAYVEYKLPMPLGPTPGDNIRYS